jgi:hypothetical protein
LEEAAANKQTRRSESFAMPTATPSPRAQSASMAQSGYFAEDAEATSSKVTLEELRKRKVGVKENDVE